MKEFAKDLACRVSGTRAGSFALRTLKQGPVILFYHGVERKLIDRAIQSLHLPLAVFERQIDYLRKHFEIISIEDFCESMVSGESLSPSQVVLTFDDGYKNNLHIVGPLLSSLGIPFSVFVSTRHISEGLRFPTYILRVAVLRADKPAITVLGDIYDVSNPDMRVRALALLSRKLKRSTLGEGQRLIDDLVSTKPAEQWSELNCLFTSDAPMDWDEVARLKAMGATIGSHCHDHAILHGSQDRGTVDEQLRVSRAAVEKRIGPCEFLAYPNGGIDDISDDAVALAHKNGYKIALSTLQGEASNDCHPFVLPRVSVETSDFPRFKFTINAAFRQNRRYRSQVANRALP